MKIWRRFVLVFAAAAAVFLSGGVSVNYFVDVAHVYHGDSPNAAAAVRNFVQQLHASPAGIPLPPFERVVKVELAEESRADCFITGSSHEMRVNLKEIAELRKHCRALMNLAVSGGSYEDFVTMAAVASKRPGAGTIYIGISPWFFRFDADSRYRTYEGEYAEARRYFGLEDRGVHTGSSAKLLNLINGQYFSRNVSEVIRTIEIETFDMEDPDNRTKESQLLLPDGSIRESDEQRRYLSSRKLPDVTPTQKNIGTYKFQGSRVDADLVRDFKSIVETLQGEKMNIIFVMSPYHPSVFACTNEAVCQWLDQMEQQVCSLATEMGVRVIGSYHPDRFSLTWNDFTDDHHVMRSALRRYWRNGCIERPSADAHPTTGRTVTTKLASP